ncbi:hypothetical protein AKO1_010496 [Acrasis kona]|uniref:Stalled ribosome sensor GCN1-like HEAT repeats region domain-containing protein n=1 Tax=Acrasis kona TaxID=1008807 RepID=A0AAW2ZJB7_9EUKA
MSGATEKHLKLHTKKLLPAVRRAVCDRDVNVQEAASQAFDVLYKVIGGKAVSDIITQLMGDLESTQNTQEDRSVALSGLKQLVRVRPQAVLPKLVPAMLQSPITNTQANALSAICASLDASQQQQLSPHLMDIVNKLTMEISKHLSEITHNAKGVMSLPTNDQSTRVGPLLAALDASLKNLQDDDLSALQEVFKQNLQSNSVDVRRSYTISIRVLFDSLQQSQDNNLLEDSEFLSEHYPMLLEHVIRLYNDPDDQVVRAAVNAADVMINSLKANKDIWPDYIDNIRDVIRSLTEDDSGTKVLQSLGGFKLDHGRGMEPLLQVFLHGLVYGKSPEVREQAALGLGDIIQLTDSASLSVHVIKITGPLIRIVGDRFLWQVKAAILKTLGLLLDKGGASIKPFLPQLQTILIKSLQDANAVVRNYAQDALVKLVPLGARPDNLVTELNGGIKTHGFVKNASHFDAATAATVGAGIVTCLLTSLRQVMSNAQVGSKLKPQVLETCTQTLLSLLCIQESGADEDSLLNKLKDVSDLISQGSSALATVLTYVTAESFRGILSTMLQPSSGVSLQSKLILTSLLITQHDMDANESAQARDLIKSSLSDYISPKADKSAIVTQGLRASGNLLWWSIQKKRSDVVEVVKDFNILLNENAPQNQLRYELVKVMKWVAKNCYKNGNTEQLYPWVKPLATIGVKDRYVPVKLCSERTLVYVLGGDAMVDYQYRATEFVSDEKEAKTISEYCQRVLTRLGQEDSDDEIVQ